MCKSCCAIGCTNRYSKDCGLGFYRFSEEPAKRAQLIATVSRKNWQPNEHTWICSAHFVGGAKSNDPLSPAYIPSVFCHVESLVTRKTECDMIRYEISVCVCVCVCGGGGAIMKQREEEGRGRGKDHW